MVPIETQLYDYVPGGYPQLRSRRPLTFRLPAAYYVDGINLKGGPAAIVFLEFDAADGKPFSTAADVIASKKASAVIPREAMLNRRVNVSVYANWLPTDMPSLDTVSRSKDFELVVPRWLGAFQLYRYSPSEHDKNDGPSAIVGGQDIGFGSYFATRSMSDGQHPEEISCRASSVCRVRMWFRGREVILTIHNTMLNELDRIRELTISLLQDNSIY